jgi:hypothetical protein
MRRLNAISYFTSSMIGFSREASAAVFLCDTSAREYSTPEFARLPECEGVLIAATEFAALLECEDLERVVEYRRRRVFEEFDGTEFEGDGYGRFEEVGMTGENRSGRMP